MEVVWIEDHPTKANPFGSNGLSECFFGGEHNAFLNGIYDAVGVRTYEIPVVPAKIKENMGRIARGEEPETPKKYFFGTSFEDELDNILANPVPTDWLMRMIAAMSKPTAEEKSKNEADASAEDAGIVEL